MTITSDNILRGHTSEDTAYVVEDYPYGFRLRTSIRYWIETTNYGDRFCSQTLNPKTNRWNKPKKSTYSELAAMYVDEIGHVQWAGVSLWSKPEFRESFLAAVGPDLSPAQRTKLAQLLGIERAFEGVTYSIHAGEYTEEDKAHQAEVERYINRRAAVETIKARAEVGF